MNKQRRAVLSKKVAELNTLMSQLEDIKDSVDTIREEEDECYWNLPDSLQESEKGEIMQENVDSLDSVVSNLDDIINQIDDNIGELQEIIDK